MSLVLSGTDGITFPDTTDQATGYANGIGFRNRIINGDMRIDQRNAGASVTPADSQYMVDRWQAFITQSSKFTAQQNAGSVTPPTGFNYYLGVTSSSAYSVGASDYFGFQQHIEYANTMDLGWGTANAKSITMSFWVRSSLTGTFGGALANYGRTRAYPFTFTISTANTWEQKTITVAGDTSGTWGGAVNTGGITVGFGLGVGATYSAAAGSWASGLYLSATGATSVVGTNGATFYITGVQLEVGSVATEFERRPYGTELALCQRYYEKTYSLSVAPGTNSQPGLVDWSTASNGSGFCVINVRFNTAKRAAPTLKGWTEGGTADNWYVSRSGSAGNQSVNLDIASEFGFRIYTNTGANWTVCRIEGHWTASAEL